MASYEEWNEALLKYVISGMPRGSRIYLAIDDEAINFISGTLNTLPGNFLEVIQERCIRNNNVRLNHLSVEPIIFQEQHHQTPPYFGFLCFMVLAAYRMGDNVDQGVARGDYFYHFNSMLGLPVDQGRPSAMEGGAEKSLWENWNNWLRVNGYEPTASMRGERYFTYARSQPLLRQSDKDSLWNFFSNYQNKYPDFLDKDEIILKLRHDFNYLTKYLQELIEVDGKLGSQRYEALADAIFEVFGMWVASGKQSERTEAFRDTFSNPLLMGLYRTENFRSNESQFYLLPKQPKRSIQDIEITVTFKSENAALIVDRPGWFETLKWNIAIDEIEKGLELITNSSRVANKLILPKRDFWILLPDPEFRDSGIFASWEERPELGIPFLLLAKKELETDLKVLKNEGLLVWSKTPKEIGAWLEFSDLVVVSDAWTGVSIAQKNLLNQLRPRNSTTISLNGGLKDPNTNAWLVNHGPEITIFTFERDLELQIIRVGEDEVYESFTVNSNDKKQPKWDVPGRYLIRARSESDSDSGRERQVAIIDWDAITLSTPEKHGSIQMENQSIFGAWVKEG
ncbi:MAG: hypothetical protein JNM46_00250 [Anaerolineales bacterium]|nr:hypothetical protein [Anaerolineales bacterium]